MLMTVKLQRNQRTALVVPERAIVPLGKSQSVFRLMDDSTVERVPVTIGARQPGFVEVLEGLAEGDQVVSDGVDGLRNGSQVEVGGSFTRPAREFDPGASSEGR